MYFFQRISDAGTLLVWRSTFLNFTFGFGTKCIDDWQLPLVVNQVMNHQPISDDILLHYGTTAVYDQSTRDCKNPIEHL